MRIDIGNGITMNIGQSLGDVKQGHLQNDLSRVSAYSGQFNGVHTGSNSPTVGRHNSVFGSPESTFFKSLKPYR